jgi:3-mercaptopyruvate sulfurtransferase SseA
VALLLKKAGVSRVRPLAGGLDAWRDLGYPLTSVPPDRGTAPAFEAKTAAGSGHAR